MNDLAEHETWQDAVAAVLPPGVIHCCAARVPDSFELHADEMAAVGQMSPERIAEFRLGRHCAHQVLMLLECESRAVPVGPHREPIWPPGLIGSIAHASGRAVAAGTPADRYAGLGLDIECLTPLPPAEAALIASQTELAAEWPMEEHLRAALLFSAKESLYKAIWPRIRRYVDFLDVSLKPGRFAGEYVAEPLRGFTREELALVTRVRGRVGRCEDLIVTAATIDPSHSTAHSP